MCVTVSSWNADLFPSLAIKSETISSADCISREACIPNEGRVSLSSRTHLLLLLSMHVSHLKIPFYSCYLYKSGGWTTMRSCLQFVSFFNLSTSGRCATANTPLLLTQPQPENLSRTHKYIDFVWGNTVKEILFSSNMTGNEKFEKMYSLGLLKTNKHTLKLFQITLQSSYFPLRLATCPLRISRRDCLVSCPCKFSTVTLTLRESWSVFLSGNQI